MGHYAMTLAWLALPRGRRLRWKAAEKLIAGLPNEEIWANEYSEAVLDSEAMHLEIDPNADWAEVMPKASEWAREALQEKLDLVRNLLGRSYAPLLAEFDVGDHHVWATGDIEYTSVGDQQTPDEALELFLALQGLTVYGVLEAAGFEATLC